MRSLNESARNVAARILRSIVILRLSFPGLVNDSTCLRVDGSHESWMSHHGVALLSSPAEGFT